MKSARLIDGRAIASAIRESVASEIKRSGLRPGLGVILVGQDQASHLYVALKEKACAEASILFVRYDFPEDVAQTDLIDAVERLNEREDIHAILVQLPLPPHLDADAVVSAIDPAKDADGFHPANLRAYLEGDGSMPGLVEAVSLLLDAGDAPPRGLACVLANSAVFSAPVETMLSRRGLEATDDPAAADVIVTAVGKPASLTKEMIKDGAIVIDVGTTRVEGKTIGDADGDLLEKAGAITPVPGGVGPMTVAMLLKKTLELSRKK